MKSATLRSKKSDRAPDRNNSRLRSREVPLLLLVPSRITRIDLETGDLRTRSQSRVRMHNSAEMRVRRNLRIESRLLREWNRNRSDLIQRIRRNQNEINKKSNARSTGNSAKSREESDSIREC
jgi:hypothetical protein